MIKIKRPSNKKIILGILLCVIYVTSCTGPIDNIVSQDPVVNAIVDGSEAICNTIGLLILVNLLS